MKTIKLDRDSILKALSDDVVQVSFTKKDGSQRIMRCTRDLKRAPQAPVPKNADYIDVSDTIRAYDLEAEGWRSFIVANVTSVTRLN